MTGVALHACPQQIATWMLKRRNLTVGASSVALFVLLGAIQRVRRRGRAGNAGSTRGRQGRFGRKGSAFVGQQQEPCPCPVLWEQIQQRDWLFGLPPQIADSILARLGIQDLKALRATCRQTYLQVAARTTKLVCALDAPPRTWRLLASPRLDRIYPGLRELRLVMAGEAATAADEGEAAEGDGNGGGGVVARRGPGPTRDSGRRGADRAAAAAGAAVGKARMKLPDVGGGAAAAAAAAAVSPLCDAERLRDFIVWSANGHLHGLTILDLSRCAQVPIHRDTWAALVGALGPGEVTLRVDWRALLHHGTEAAASDAAASAADGRRRRHGGGGSAAAAAAAAIKAKAAAAKAAGLLTSPAAALEAAASAGEGGAAAPSQLLLLPPLPPPPPPRCSCSICGPAPPDAAPVVSALQVLAQLRPCCSVELAGRGLPVRSPSVLQQLCAVSQLASVSMAVCGVRPLAHHAGWFSCLRRLHSLELRYREEPVGHVALHQIIRALQAPVPLRSLTLHCPTTHPLDEADLAALAQLPGLSSLDAPGLRVHVPIPLAMSGLTRLALRSDRLELTQPLAALFPSLEHLELGNGAGDLPPTSVLAAAAAAAPGGEGLLLLRHVLAAPVGPAADEFPGAAAGQVLADELVVPPVPVPAPPPAAAAAAGAAWVWLDPPAAIGGPQQHPPPPQQQQQLQHIAQSLLPRELTLHLRLLQGLSGLRVLSIGGKPGHGVEALSSLTALSSLILVRCSEFRPLRKAVEELRGLTQLRSLELHACLGGDACGYEIARLLRRLQKLPNLSRLVVHGCDPRLPQQLATAPLGRLAELQLLGLPELQPLDLRYVVQAQTACRRLVVRGCGRLERQLLEGLPAAMGRPLLSVEWTP